MIPDLIKSMDHQLTSWSQTWLNAWISIRWWHDPCSQLQNTVSSTSANIITHVPISTTKSVQHQLTSWQMFISPHRSQFNISWHHDKCSYVHNTVSSASADVMTHIHMSTTQSVQHQLMSWPILSCSKHTQFSVSWCHDRKPYNSTNSVQHQLRP